MDTPLPYELMAEELCRRCVAALGVTGAALILMSTHEIGATVVSSDRGTSVVEDLQFTLGEGPCLQAFHSGQAVLEPELLGVSSEQWPEFSREAVANGARAVFVFPLQLGAARLGVLYSYRAVPGMLSAEQLAQGFELATRATALLVDAQAGASPGELGDALAGEWRHRAQVHQATGMVAAQLGVDLAEGVARLRARAFGTGRSVYDVAVDVVGRRLRFEE